MTGKLSNLFRRRELCYPANLLTLLRLLLVPVILRFLRRPEDRWRAVGTLGVALLTDAVDGTLARRRDEISNLGKLLDPVTDKLLLNGVALTLSRSRGFPWWASGLLLARDIAILLGGALIVRRRVQVVSARLSGKVATLTFGTALLIYTVDGPRTGRPVLYVAMATVVASILDYAREFWRRV